ARRRLRGPVAELEPKLEVACHGSPPYVAPSVVDERAADDGHTARLPPHHERTSGAPIHCWNRSRQPAVVLSQDCDTIATHSRPMQPRREPRSGSPVLVRTGARSSPRCGVTKGNDPGP